MTRLCDLKCESCNKNTIPLTHQEATDLAASADLLRSWQIAANSMQSIIEFSHLQDAAQFLQEVARISDTENHHPELTIQSDFFKTVVSIKLHTYAIQALSQNDLILAAKIDAAFDNLFSR